MAKQPKLPVSEPVHPEKQGPGDLAAILTGLDRHVAHAIKELDEMHNPDRAAELALLGQKMAAMVGEMRKIEKEQRQATTALSHGAVMAYLRGLPPEKRAHVVRELADLDSGKSVLA